MTTLDGRYGHNNGRHGTGGQERRQDAACTKNEETQKDRKEVWVDYVKEQMLQKMINQKNMKENKMGMKKTQNNNN